MDDFTGRTRALARNLRVLREARRITQEQLALRAEVDRSYVSQLERGVANPSLRMLCTLAAELRVRVEDLLAIDRHDQ